MVPKRLQALFTTLYGDIALDELPRIMWLSALLCCIIGGFWLLDSLKDTVLATTVGLEHQPKAKAISVLVTLVVVAAYNNAINRVRKPVLFYVFGAFYGCVFVVIGASMSLGPVIDFSDSMIFAMALPNIIGLYLLMPVVKREVNQYFAKIKSGEIRKVKGH